MKQVVEVASQVPSPTVPVSTVNVVLNVPVAEDAVVPSFPVSQPPEPLWSAHSTTKRVLDAGKPEPDSVTVSPFDNPVVGVPVAAGVAADATPDANINVVPATATANNS